MDEREKDLANQFYEDAKQTLYNAKASFMNKYYNETVSHSFYAVYGAEKAVLALDDFDLTKTRMIILGAFNKSYISSGVFPLELGTRIGKLKYMNEMCNPDNGYFATQEDAQNQLETAEYFISLVNEYLQSKGLSLS